MLHPGVAARSCADCVKYMHRDSGGRFGEMMTRGGEPTPRTPGAKTPCVFCPKIPPGAAPKPENAVEVTPQLADCLTHYLECRAVGQFPADPIVRTAAVLIRQVEDAVSRRTALTVLDAMRGE